MALYRLELKAVSRSSGRQVCAAAAYAARAVVHDERQGLTFKFTGKRDLIHSEIIAPPDAPTWALERGQLWNRVEAAEKRKDATTARELTLALPCEIDRAAQIAAVRSFVREQIASRGLIADVAIHEPDRIDGTGKQPHVHILISTRALENDAFAAKKLDWLARPKHADAEMKALRAAWADTLNATLEIADRPERVSHLSRADQRTELARRAEDANAPLSDRAAAASKIVELRRDPESKIGHTIVAQARREVSNRAEKTGEVVSLADHLVSTSPAAAKVLEARAAVPAPPKPIWAVSDEADLRRLEQDARRMAQEATRKAADKRKTEEAEKELEREKARRQASEERQAAITRAQSVLRRKARLEKDHLDWLSRAAPMSFPGDKRWDAARAAVKAAEAALRAERRRLADENEKRRAPIAREAAALAEKLRASAAAIAERVLAQAPAGLPDLGVTRLEDGALKGPTIAAVGEFIRWLSRRAEALLTDTQRAKLDEQRAEAAFRNRYGGGDEARPGFLRRAVERLVTPAVLTRLEAAAPALEALYEAVRPIERSVERHNASKPAVAAAAQEALRQAEVELDGTRQDLQQAWREDQPLPEDLAWLALQPRELIVEARALNDAEDAAERKAEAEAERRRLADEAAAKRAARIDALRAGFAESADDWDAARADNASRIAARKQELDELLARRRELEESVNAALSGAPEETAISHGEEALREIRQLVDDARALLEPPSSGYGWSPFEP